MMGEALANGIAILPEPQLEPLRKNYAQAVANRRLTGALSAAVLLADHDDPYRDKKRAWLLARTSTVRKDENAAAKVQEQYAARIAEAESSTTQAHARRMIIVDTSVLIDHLNETDPHLEELLGRGRVRIHPFVLGEIALGKLRKRSQVLNGLSGLQAATLVSDADVVAAIGALSLDGTGIGYVDVHLLLSAKLEDVKLWTRDKRLAVQAERLGVEYQPLQ